MIDYELVTAFLHWARRRNMARRGIKASRMERLARERAARARAHNHPPESTRRLPCIRCGIERKAHLKRGRVRICVVCWRGMDRATKDHLNATN